MMNTLDLILIAFIIVVAFISAKRGLLLSLLRLAAVFIGGILAKILSGPCAQVIYALFFKSAVTDKLYEIMPSGSVSGEINSGIDGIMSNFPAFVSDIAEKYGFYPSVSSGGLTALSVENIETSYVTPVITGILSLVSFVLLVIILTLVLKRLAWAINRHVVKSDHAVINGTNKLLGGVLGAVRALIPACVICAILIFAAPVLGNSSLTDLVDGSFACDLISNILF